MSSDGYIAQLANVVGASEPALRLLLSVLLGYPLAFFYRFFVYRKNALLNHIYFAVSGMSIVVFNYGYDIYHSLIAITVTYLLIRTLTGTPLVAISFVFNMSYLLGGYYLTGTETYDIKWTMPHCVLALRLIGLTFDVSDGQRPEQELSAINKLSCLKRIPSVIEILAYAYYPASLLVGPQFPFRRYNSFINKEFDKYTDNFNSGLARGAIGLVYLMVYQIGSANISDEYLLSPEYANQNILWRWLLMGLWGKFVLYKYIQCWLLAEGAATCFGLTFVEIKDGKEDWSGCTNIRLILFENARRYQNYVTAFNVNTNHWLAEYVYKRLKYLGNRNISHFAALMFLAVWHGFHSGYYMCFVMEFVVIHSEKQVLSVLDRNEKFQNFIALPILRPIIFLIVKLYTIVGMGYCLIPFVFLTFSKWWHLYKVVNFIGFIMFIPGPIYGAILSMVLPPTASKRND